MKAKISQNRVHFESQAPMTHPDTPRIPNSIQIKTGKEIASMHESLMSDEAKVKQFLQSSEPSNNETVMRTGSEDEVPWSYMVPSFEQVGLNKGKIPYAIPNISGNHQSKMPVNLMSKGDNTRDDTGMPSLSREGKGSSETSASGVEEEVNELVPTKTNKEEELLHLKQLDEYGIKP